MTRSEAVAYVQAMTACALAEIEGMKAENTQREKSGYSPAFVFDDFSAVIEKYGIHHNAVIGLFQQSVGD